MYVYIHIHIYIDIYIHTYKCRSWMRFWKWVSHAKRSKYFLRNVLVVNYSWRLSETPGVQGQ